MLSFCVPLGLYVSDPPLPVSSFSRPPVNDFDHCAESVRCVISSVGPKSPISVRMIWRPGHSQLAFFDLITGEFPLPNPCLLVSINAVVLVLAKRPPAKGDWYKLPNPFLCPTCSRSSNGFEKKILLLHPVCGIVGDKWAMMVDDFEILLKYRSKGIVIKFHKLSHARKNPLLIQIKFL